MRRQARKRAIQMKTPLFTLTRSKLGAALAAGVAALAVIAPIAAAAQEYTEPYLIYFDITSAVAVSDIAIFNQGVHGCCGYGFAANGQAIDAGNTTITDGFTKTDEAAGAFLVGLTVEPDESTGVVVFGNATFAADYTGKPFSAAFSGLDEATLIGYLQDPNDNVGNIFNFADTYGSEMTFVPGQPFTEVEFSDGAVVGGGTSYETVVPEPSAWALMIVGVGLVGGMRRYGRRTIASA
jgi:hypothetical protein